MNQGMIGSEALVVISPKDIKKDSSALFWSDEPDQRLIHSLAEMGQLCPILVGKDGETFHLLSGYRRVLALEQLGRTVVARTMAMPDKYNQGLIYLDDNAGRAVSPGQMIQALRYFKTNCGTQSWFEPVISRFNLSGTSRTAQHLQLWLALPNYWDQLLLLEHIPLETGSLLAKFGLDDRAAIRPFFETLAWSRGNAMNFLTWLWERGRMDGVGVETIVASSSLGSFLKADLSPKDQIQRITAMVKELRYPSLSSAQIRVHEACRRLVRGTPWRAEHLGEFENQEILLSIKVQSENEAKKAAIDLQGLCNSRELSDLWAAFPKQDHG